MKTILSLPSEIIDIISTKLTKQDFCICLCVSKSWYDVFIHKLYKQLDIKSEQQLQQICNNLLKQAPRSLADSVRVIHLRSKHIKNNYLSQLSAWCINVETFSLHWSIWNEDQKEIDTLDSNDFSTSMASVIGPLRRLIRLHLDVSFGKNNATIPDFLPYLSHLTYLSLANSNHITLDYIEYIHQQCPVLQTLCLQGMDVTRLPLFNNDDNNQDQDHHPSFDNMIPIRPATSLRSIELEFVNGGYEYYPYWLIYFSKKYPNLNTFKMYQYSSFISSETLSSYHRSNTQLNHYAMSSLVTGCSQLSNVYLQNMYVHPDFFKTMGFRLHHLFSHFIDLKILPQMNINMNNIINDDQHQLANAQPPPPPLPSLPITGLRYLSTIFNYSSFSHHLTSLDIAPPTNDTIYPVTPDTFLSSLSHLDQLKHLSIRWKVQLAPFYLDSILHTFPHLVSLSLTFMTLLVHSLDHHHFSSSSSSSPSSSLLLLLETLSLKGVVFHHNLFSWINRHLLSLSHLTLKNSCRSYYAKDNNDNNEDEEEVKDTKLLGHHIILPDLKLQSLKINESKHQQHPIRLYMLHQVNQIKKNPQNINATTPSSPSLLDIYLPRFSHLSQQRQHGNSGSIVNEGNEIKDQHAWYFLKTFDNEMAWQSVWAKLNAEQNFEWVVQYHQVKKTCPWYADFCDAADEVYRNSRWDKDKVNDIQGIDYMNIVCRSIKSLYINDKFVPFI
ncbi:hypothetical protein BJ944DRAFT_268341 [Cunninghamella echinulata]|nr:hypothetical protein BJ944DRAFT_268341 [Cunninghamella echinulata]